MKTAPTTHYLVHHNKIVRHEGNTYKIIAHSLGRTVLVEAECIVGGERGARIDLIRSRSNLSRALRDAIKMNLVS